MIRLLIISLYSLVFVIQTDQPAINYNHKRVYKELEKTWGMETPTLKELEIPESLLEGNSIQGKYFRIINNNVSQHFIYIGRVNSCRAGGCSISFEEDFIAESEYFDYFIVFDDSKTVQQVRVFNYQATHGQEVSAKGWLKQFEGYNTSATLEVGKNVDAIAGATISVYSITEDVQLKTLLLKKM